MSQATLDVYVDCDEATYGDDVLLQRALDEQLKHNIEDRKITYKVVHLRGPGGGNPCVKFESPSVEDLFDFVVNYWGPEQAFSVEV